MNSRLTNFLQSRGDGRKFEVAKYPSLKSRRDGRK
jgi:hypothetical protein